MLAWRDTGKWKRDMVKEAPPLPLVVLSRLEAAFVNDPGDDVDVLSALLVMVWASLRWSAYNDYGFVLLCSTTTAC